jgi:di/tricarboxylate transporter
MIITFIILAVTIALFIWNRLPSEIVALLAMLALFLAGILDLSQTLAGFADPTVIMVAGLFVVGEGLTRTGVTAWLGQQLLRLGGSTESRLLGVVMSGTGALSGLLSNTGTVAMLLPAVVGAAWRARSVPSRFLIPLAFAANLGGLLTLVGTSPNIVVADALTMAGLPTFGFFEFAWIGLPLLIVTIAFTVLVGKRLLPSYQTDNRPIDLDASVHEMVTSYQLSGKLFQATVLDDSPLVGQSPRSSQIGQRYGVSILRVQRTSRAGVILARVPAITKPGEGLRNWLNQTNVITPEPATILEAGDVLLLKGSVTAVPAAMQALQLEGTPIDATEQDMTRLLLSDTVGVVEVLLTPRSEYLGSTVVASQLASKFDIQVISLKRGSQVLPRQTTTLEFGDQLLLQGTWEAIEQLQRESRNFVVVGSPEAMTRQVVHLGWRAVIAVLSLLLMIVLMLTKAVPTAMAVLITALIMVLTRCLSTSAAYRAINWPAVILIAAMLPVGTALQVTGGAELIANTLVSTVGAIGPIALLAGVYLLTAGLSQVISNTATAVLMAPIVMQTAASAGYEPYALLMMVAVGAASAFLTPVSSPTNTLVFAPGGYKFGDYGRLGLPLLVIVLLVSLVLVPRLWPM